MFSSHCLHEVWTRRQSNPEEIFGRIASSHPSPCAVPSPTHDLAHHLLPPVNVCGCGGCVDVCASVGVGRVCRGECKGGCGVCASGSVRRVCGGVCKCGCGEGVNGSWCVVRVSMTTTCNTASCLCETRYLLHKLMHAHLRVDLALQPVGQVSQDARYVLHRLCDIQYMTWAADT